MPGKFENPDYIEILSSIARSARNAGKTAGILLPDPGLGDLVQELGYTFVAAGADGGMVMNGLTHSLQTLSKYNK